MNGRAMASSLAERTGECSMTVYAIVQLKLLAKGFAPQRESI
jgi:hypothetical protein